MSGPPRLNPARPAPLESAQRFPWTAIGIFAGVGLFVYFAWLWLAEGEPVGAAIILGPLLIIVTTPLFIRANRITPGFDLGGLLLLGLVMRFGFAYYRFTNAADAYEYHRQGVRLAGSYRNLDFSAATGQEVPGTGAMRAISGGLHVIVGDNFFASFLLLTWLSFLGCWFLYRAFTLAVDDADAYRYARLILLWPSMAFWPSSLGKDGWMVFTIGVASYGVARVLRRMAGGYMLLGVGLLGASFVRPHLALLALFAFVVALLIGRRHTVRAVTTPGFVAKLVGLGLVLVIGSVLISRTQELLGIDDFSGSSLESAATVVGQRTDTGESAFTPANPRSPAGFVEAAVTVLFRPFPNEASGAEQLLTSLEGILLIAITAFSGRRLLTIPRRARPQPYVLYALVYVLLWILAFGVIANFGILARQRTQMLPFYFALLSVPAVVAKPAAARAKPTVRTPR